MRRSIRRFEPRPVETEKVEALVEARRQRKLEAAQPGAVGKCGHLSGALDDAGLRRRVTEKDIDLFIAAFVAGLAVQAKFKEAGRHSVAEFWIPFQGRFVHIRYFAVRDEAGTYLGTLEVTQDLTRLRALEGEQRLLQYDKPL